MPKGNIYYRSLVDIGSAWKKAQGNNSRYIIYPNGVQGSESNTVRRMRIGQLDAAMLSIIGLKEIDESVTALQLMPFVFRSWDEFDYVHQHLRKGLEHKLFEKGFVVLYWGEGGWVQFFTTVPRLTPEDFKPARVFAWAGTPSQVNLMKSLGYKPVVMGLSDILAALQTGMIDTVPASPMWALAFQFYSKTKHMLRINYVPIVGATIITRKTWNKMTPEAREALRVTSKEAEKKLRANRIIQDEESIKAMQEKGLVVHNISPEVEQEWMDLFQKAWPYVRGNIVPAEMFDRVQNLLAEYRNQE